MITENYLGSAIRSSKGPWRRACERLLRKPKALFGIAVIVLLYGTGLFAFWIAPYGYDDQNLMAARQGPSLEHILGTHWVGRDILSSVI